MIFTAIQMLKSKQVLNLTGSMKFNGTNSTLIYQKDNDMMPNSDFTIEWYQYQTDSNLYPRVFAVGATDTNNVHIGVSLESGTFYFWPGNTAVSFGSIGTFKNRWTHFAISRSGNSLNVFKDGIQLGSTLTNTTNFNNPSTDLTIGNEGGVVNSNTAFGGWITNFRWIKGTALYTSNFTRPLSPLSNISPNTKLLLLATSNATVTTDSSSSARSATISNVTWQSFDANLMS
jgi:hypothetical protein